MFGIILKVGFFHVGCGPNLLKNADSESFHFFFL